MSDKSKKLAYSIEEAIYKLSIGRSFFYQLVAEGKIEVKKAGTRSLVRHAELERYLSECPTLNVD